MLYFRRSIVCVAVGLFLLVALTGCEPDPDARFVSLRDDFFLKQLEWNPVTSTYLGGSGYSDELADSDTRLRDWRPEALEAEVTYFQRMQADLAAIPAETLSAGNQLDYTVMAGELAFLAHQIGDLKMQEYAVETYVVEPVNGVNYQLQQLTDAGGGLYGTDAEWLSLVARIGKVPAYLEVARTNLEAGVAAGNLPDGRLVQRDGIDGAAGAAAFFGEELPEMAADYLGDRPFTVGILAALETACAAAADAYDDFGAALTALYPAKDAADRYAIGEEEYAWRIENNFGIDESLVELYAYGEDQVAYFETELFDNAQAIAREDGLELPFDTDDAKRDSTRAVLAYLAQDAPADDAALLALYGALGDAAVAYGREQGLFDIPENYQLDIVETPKVLRSSIFAAYNPAPPFKPGAVGAFYVTPTGNDPAQLARNSASAIAAVAVHEGFPGHDWQYRTMSQHSTEITNLRWLTIGAIQDMSSMWSDSMGSEGWAHYSEQLMSEPVEGHPFGFYTRDTYMSFLTQALMRAARVRVDIGLHTGWMSYDEAVDYMAAHYGLYPDAREMAGSDPDAAAVFAQADREVYRYTKWPTQAITYNLAKRAVLDLREACEIAWGDAYSEQAFHEAVMRQGTVPPGYYGPVVLAAGPGGQ